MQELADRPDDGGDAGLRSRTGGSVDLPLPTHCHRADPVFHSVGLKPPRACGVLSGPAHKDAAALIIRGEGKSFCSGADFGAYAMATAGLVVAIKLLPCGLIAGG